MVTTPAARSLRALLPPLALGVFLAGCARPGAAVPRVELFDRHEIVLGPSGGQTVLTGFLLDGPVSNLVALSAEGDGQHGLRIYALERGNWTLELDANLRPEVDFVDVANIGGRDRLITYEPGLLAWFDPSSSTTHELAETTCSFKPLPSAGVPHLDVTRDVNGDGRDDLVVPDFEGFQVFVQLEGGTFADPVKIGPPPRMRGFDGAERTRFDPWSQSRIHEVDYDRDGRRDLVFWNEDHFEVHLQDERGLFAPVPRTSRIDVEFDSDDPHSLTSGDLRGRVLHSLTDLDGDGLGDLVIFELAGSNRYSVRSSYQVHFGTAAPGATGATAFPPRPDVSVRSKGVQLSMAPMDLDGDGRIDLMTRSVPASSLRGNPYRRFAGFMGDSIPMNIQFFRMDAGLYPEDADSTHRTDVLFPGPHSGPGWIPLDLALQVETRETRHTPEEYRNAFRAPLLLGDVTGDGRLDLLLGRACGMPDGSRQYHGDRIDVFVGQPVPDPFPAENCSVRVPLPANGDNVWLTDLDADGKQDVVLHDPFRPGPNRVTTLIAR